MYILGHAVFILSNTDAFNWIWYQDNTTQNNTVSKINVPYILHLAPFHWGTVPKSWSWH